MNSAPDDHGQESAASASHLPVMLGQILEAIQPEAGKTIIDGTFGGGGYTRALLDAGASVIAMDRDPTAIEAGRTLEAQSAGRLTLVGDRFSRLDRVPFDGDIHGVVLDVGVSSMQIDQPERGFSFRNDGPLDMRMSASGPTAADIVNAMEIDDLVLVLRTYGEERHAGRIARAIDRRRLQTPFETTADLAQLVEAVIGRKPGDRIHPATRVFQGLRIFVNDELGELALALEAAERVLVTDGRLAVVTFHSLEDRLVKAFLRDRGIAAQASRHLPPKNVDAATFLPLTKSAVRPHEDEIEQNPRSRSARLRAAVRTDQKPRSEGMDGDDVTARAVASRSNTHERLHRLHRHWKTAC